MQHSLQAPHKKGATADAFQEDAVIIRRTFALSRGSFPRFSLPLAFHVHSRRRMHVCHSPDFTPFGPISSWMRTSIGSVLPSHPLTEKAAPTQSQHTACLFLASTPSALTSFSFAQNRRWGGFNLSNPVLKISKVNFLSESTGF